MTVFTYKSPWRKKEVRPKNNRRCRRKDWVAPGQLSFSSVSPDFIIPQDTTAVATGRPRSLLYKEESQKKRRDDEKAIREHIPLLKTIIRQQYNKYSAIPIDEIFQLGMIALLKAVRRYDSSKGYKFSSIALPFILGEWRHYIRDKNFFLHAPGYVRRRGMAIRRLLDKGYTLMEIEEKLGIDWEQARLDLRATTGVSSDWEGIECAELDSEWL